MSYVHSAVERVVANRVNLATDTSYFLSSGYQPFVLRAAAVVVTTAIATSSVTVTINHRPTAGSATGATTVDVITVPVSTAAGIVVFVDGLERAVLPGEELEFVVGGTGTGNGDIVAFVDSAWNTPANNADMLRSA